MQVTEYLQSRKLLKPLTQKKPEKISDDHWEELDATAFVVVRLTADFGKTSGIGLSKRENCWPYCKA